MVSRAIRGRSTARIRNAGPETDERRHHVAVRAAHRRGHRVQSFLQLLERLGVAADADLPELGDERRRVDDRVGRQALERPRQEAIPLGLRHVGQQHLPVRRAMQRRAAPDPAHAHDRARARDLVDVDDRVAGEHAEVHRLARPLGEVLQDRVGGPDEVETRHRRPGQPDETEAEAVLLGHRIAFDETSFGERGDQSRGRGLVDVEEPSELGHAERARLGDQLQRADRPRDRLEIGRSFVSHVATPSAQCNVAGPYAYASTAVKATEWTKGAWMGGASR